MTKKSASLLVVDDEEHIRSAIAGALRLEGFRVDSADSGASALKLLTQQCYDLMILDIRMPEVDGVQLMAQVHRQFPDLLVIVLTGFASLESAIAAVKAGAVDYLEKPVRTQEIVRTVKRVLQRRARRRPVSEEMTGKAGATADPDEAISDGIAVFPLVLDYAEQRVRLGQDNDPAKVIQLTPAETEILLGLMQHPDEMQTYTQIVSQAWGQTRDALEAQRLLRPHISRLRRKLRKILPGHQIIETVRTKGYRYAPQLSPR